MLGLRTHALISASLFAAIVVMAMIGNALQKQGLLPESPTVQLAAKVVFFGLFLFFGFSCIPLMLKLFLAGQTMIGNGELRIIRGVAAHETGIVVGAWLFLLAGLAIAVPAAIQDGFFGPLPPAALSPAEGTLVVEPGMSVDDMKRRSTLKIKGSADSVFASGGVFDFKIGDGGVTLANCRYYFITTTSKDRTHIDMMSIGTSQRKVSRTELEAQHAALRARLAEAGWLAGHEVYRDEQDRILHGRRTRGEPGAVWLKGDTVLHILEKRMDEGKAGDPKDIGEWIQFVDLGRRQRWSGFERYVFEKP